MTRWSLALLLAFAATARAQEAPLPSAQDVLADALGRARESGALSRVLGERAFACWEGKDDLRRVRGLLTVVVSEHEGDELRVVVREETFAGGRIDFTVTLERDRVRTIVSADVIPGRRYEGSVAVVDSMIDTRSVLTTDETGALPAQNGRHPWRSEIIPESLLHLVLPALADQGLPRELHVQPYLERMCSHTGGPRSDVLRTTARDGGFESIIVAPVGKQPDGARVSSAGRIERVRSSANAWDLEAITPAERDRLRADPAVRAADETARTLELVRRNETLAVGLLTRIAASQLDFVKKDPEGDAARSLAELVEFHGAYGRPLMVLSQPSVRRETDAGIFVLRGYCFAVRGEGPRWVGWAWPEQPGASGERIYVVNDRAAVHLCPQEAAATAQGLDLPEGATPLAGNR